MKLALKQTSKVAQMVENCISGKNYPNSFRETELLDYLQSISSTELVFVGKDDAHVH
jgi:hypothetical protein